MQRQNNYDLLRVIATFAVILLHVSGLWIVSAGGIIKNHTIITLAYLYNDLSRFAVPCFLMLSGALLMANERELSFAGFYKKSFKKLGIPTIIFSFIYTVYSYFAFKFGVFKLKGAMFSTLVQRWLQGVPMFHMWYLYMLFWIYLFTPFVKIIKARITKSAYTKMGIVLCVAATISSAASAGRYVAWDIGRAFEFLRYFIIGDVIFANFKNVSNKKGFMFILGGILVEVYAALSASFKLNTYFKIGTVIFPSNPISPLTPLATIASILFFMGFTMLKVKGCPIIKKLSDLSFNIYLIHALIIEVLIRIPVFKWGMRWILNNVWIAVGLPVIAFLVFVISFGLGLLYNSLYSQVVKERG